MRSTLTTPWSLLFVVACGAFGPIACGSCGDKSNGAAAADAGGASLVVEPSPSSSASAARRVIPLGGAAGPTGTILVAARTLELKEEQRAKLDRVEQSLRGDDASPRDEMRAFHTDLAAGIRAGKLDQAKLDADVEALDKAAKDRHDKEAAALNDVYAALEPAQRKEVVAKIRERQTMQERRTAARMAAHDGGGPDAGARGAMTPARRLERLTRELDLDAEQQKKAQTAAPKDDPKAPAPADLRAENKKRTDALLAAFEKDGFDAKKLDAPDPRSARAAAQEELNLVSALLPILRAEQREKLAARMERPQPAGGPGTRVRGPRTRHGLPHKFAPGEGPSHDMFDDDEDDDAPAPAPSGSSAPGRE